MLTAASDAITGEGGLAGWTKRTGICSNNTLPCAQRLPANNLGSYRNVQYENPGCQGPAGHVQDHGLTSGCPDFGTAGAHFGYNYSSGNLTIRVFDGSDCLCGKFTPINPWNGGGRLHLSELPVCHEPHALHTLPRALWDETTPAPGWGCIATPGL